MKISRIMKCGILVLLIGVLTVGVVYWYGRNALSSMNPGLGLKDLHSAGIDGTGVSVAILDQKLLLEHTEYGQRLAYYRELQPLDGEGASMHGSAVSSILVGKNCGSAPGASLYYWAVATRGEELGGVRDAGAIRDIIQYNKTLPIEKRIRILSISTGYRAEEGGDEFVKAIREARDSGILVFTSTFPCFTDPVIAVYNAALKKGGSREVFDDYEVQPVVVQYRGQSAEAIVQERHQQGNNELAYRPVWVPVEPRLLASHRGSTRYEFFEEGGDSWAAPFVAGVAALLLQVNRGLSNRQVVEIIVDTTVENKQGLRMIAPQKAVARAQESLVP